MAALNYNHLRYFQTVAHAGGLTRAAERLNLSPSALSVQLQKLEHQLGHALFDRTGRALVLTEAGRIALDYADSLFKAGDEMVATLAGRPADRRQVLRVGALTTLSRNFQLRFLQPLIGRADVELIVRSAARRDLLALLDAHEIDVALTNGPAPRDARTPWTNHLLDAQPVSLVGRPRAGAPPFRFPHDLHDEPLLLPSRDSGVRAAFDVLLERAGVRPVILAEVDDMAMLRLLAREREATTLTPPIVVRDELERGELVERCRVPDVMETFYAITQARRFPNRLVAELLPRGDAAADG